MNLRDALKELREEKCVLEAQHSILANALEAVMEALERIETTINREYDASDFCSDSVRELVKGLRKFARHHPECDMNYTKIECDCGFYALLEKNELLRSILEEK